jgi:predicted dehydrogenase
MNAARGPSPDDVGVAVVGTGYWGPNLVRNFLACDETWLVTVCDLDLERARKVVGRYASITVTDDLSVVLDDDRIHAVAIATPAATHHAVGMACVRAGKHVLIEKPLASTVAEAEELVAAAAAAGVVLMCDHTFCYTAAVNRIRDEVGSGSLGEIQYVDSVRINLGLVQHDADVFWDLLPHDISILDSVLPGGFAPVAVSALGVDPIDAGHLCVGYVTMVLPGNAIAHVHVSWLSPVKIRTFVIGGSRRHLVWDDTNPAQKIALYERGVDIERLTTDEARRDKMIQYRIGDMLAPALSEHEALQGVARELVAAIREKRAPMTDGESGVRVLRVLEAAHRSLAANGALVSLAGGAS